MPRFTRLLLLIALAVVPRAGLGQGYAPPSGSRPDPYAPQYAPPTVAPPPPQGQPSAIGLPPVPNLGGDSPTPSSPPPQFQQPQSAAAAPRPSYYQPQNQPPYAPYSSGGSPAVRPPVDSMRYPLGAMQQPAPPAAVQPVPSTPIAAPPVSTPVVTSPPTAAPSQELAQGEPVQPGPPQPGAAAYGNADEVVVSDKEVFEPGKTVAIVGNQWILWGDVLPTLNQYLAPAYAKAKSQAEVAQIEAASEKLAQQILDQMINNKLMYLEFMRKVEKQAGKNAAEAKAEIAKKVRDNFDKELLSMQQKMAEATPEEREDLLKKDPYVPRLALIMHENNLLLLADLDAHLRKTGSSLEKQRRAWGEYNIGRMGIRENINLTPEVSHQEMIDYYREHAAEFGVKAKAKFEILTVRFDKFPTKEAAWQAMAAMGNEVFFGAQFSAVAKKGSQEPNAALGGQYDWTNRGSLASEVIDQAIFSLEIGKLSQILEDDRGFHIIRVIERTDAGQVPFVEAQKKIKEAIIAAKKDKEFKAYAASLKSKTPVWTIYDAPTEVADAPGDRTNLAPR